MIQTDLPDGPGSPLVRGLAACLSSVTELPLAQLPRVRRPAGRPRARLVEELARGS